MDREGHGQEEEGERNEAQGSYHPSIHSFIHPSIHVLGALGEEEEGEEVVEGSSLVLDVLVPPSIDRNFCLSSCVGDLYAMDSSSMEGGTEERERGATSSSTIFLEARGRAGVEAGAFVVEGEDDEEEEEEGCVCVGALGAFRVATTLFLVISSPEVAVDNAGAGAEAEEPEASFCFGVEEERGVGLSEEEGGGTMRLVSSVMLMLFLLRCG